MQLDSRNTEGNMFGRFKTLFIEPHSEGRLPIWGQDFIIKDRLFKFGDRLFKFKDRLFKFGDKLFKFRDRLQILWT